MTGRWTGNSATERSEELPPDWEQIRQRVLDRDGGRCVWELAGSGARCPNDATDVDHIGSKRVHELWNLRSLCGPHHDKRTALQGAKEAAARRALPPRRRKNRDHPGLGWR
jgi:5-methylcytosine-specific restriction endonuclease McrA